jgi:hypothetical protein
MKIRLVMMLALLVSLAACIQPGRASEKHTPARGPIRAEELTNLGTGNALAAVRALRPGWLRTPTQQSMRGHDRMVVYFEQLRLGGLDALQSMSITDIGKIEFVPAHEAQFRFGPGHLNGAIVVLPVIH